MIDLLLSLIDLEQREVISVYVQRIKMHENGALPVLDLSLAAEALNCLSPSSQWSGDASCTTPPKWLRCLRKYVISVYSFSPL